MISSGLHPHPVADEPQVVDVADSGVATGAWPDHAGTVALEARLDEFPIDLLLAFVAGSGRSGILQVEGARPVVFYLADGELCGGESLDTPLLRGALRSASHAGSDVRDLVEDHLLTALAATLLPVGAVVRFRPGPADTELSRFRFALADTLDDARHRMEAWRVIADVLPSTELVLQLADDLPTSLEQVVIERADWQVLSRVDGRRSVTDIISDTGRSAFDVCSSLYRMIVLGVITAP